MARGDSEDLGKKFVITLPRMGYRLKRFQYLWGSDFAEPVHGVDYRVDDVVKIAESLDIEPIGGGGHLPNLAIFLSHHKIWREVSRHRWSKVTIFEDDATGSGDPWIREGEGFVRWFWDNPEWVGALCYTLTPDNADLLLTARHGSPIDWYLYYMGFTAISTTRPVYPSGDSSYIGYSADEEWIPGFERPF